MRIVTTLVLHHTGMLNIEGKKQTKGIVSGHKRRFLFQLPPGMSYHHLIEEDGSTVKGRPEFTVGHHAGNYPVNLVSIGIALTGNFTLEEPKKKQLNTLARLTVDTCVKYRIPRSRIKMHSDVRKEPTECPGVDLLKLIEEGGQLDREVKRKLDVMRAVRLRTSAFVPRYWLLTRKIRWLETQF